MSRFPTTNLDHEDRIFILHGWGETKPRPRFVVLTERPVKVEKVRNAWVYAVRYTAKGLDLPDHQAAINLMMQRHPSWQIVESICPNVMVDLEEAGEDQPET